MSTTTLPGQVRRGMDSPWGPAQDVTPLADGIWFISTSSHGGLLLSPERLKDVPEIAFIGGHFGDQRRAGWFEEDCDWCIPFVVHEAAILATGEESAVAAIRSGQHKSFLRQRHPQVASVLLAN